MPKRNSAPSLGRVRFFRADTIGLAKKAFEEWWAGRIAAPFLQVYRRHLWFRIISQILAVLSVIGSGLAAMWGVAAFCMGFGLAFAKASGLVEVDLGYGVLVLAALAGIVCWPGGVTLALLISKTIVPRSFRILCSLFAFVSCPVLLWAGLGMTGTLDALNLNPWGYFGYYTPVGTVMGWGLTIASMLAFFVMAPAGFMSTAAFNRWRGD